MITFFRFSLLIFMVLFSCLFSGFLVYSIRDSLQGGSMSLDVGLWLNSLFFVSLGVLSMTLIAGSPFGDTIARLFFPLRKMSLRDEERLKPIVENIRALIKEKYGTDIEINPYVMDAPHINGMALGRSTIAVSTGLLKVASDEEVSAIVAHEAGHLHHRDGFFNLALAAASYPTFLLNYLMNLIVFWGPKPRLLPSGGQDFGFVAGLCIFILAVLLFIYFIVFWVLSFPVIWLYGMLESTAEWPIEYRADRFAHDLGFGPALIQLFERIEDEDVRQQIGFLANYAYSHPPTALRIDQIERHLLSDRQEAA